MHGPVTSCAETFRSGECPDWPVRRRATALAPDRVVGGECDRARVRWRSASSATASIVYDDRVVALVGAPLADSDDVAADLKAPARGMLTALLDEELLKLRRLVISNASRAPQLGRAWYDLGFERVLTTLASAFRRLSERALLSVQDPLIAANHFVGMLLWIPLNQAMFTGEMQHRTPQQRNHLADAAVDTFLRAYGPSGG